MNNQLNNDQDGKRPDNKDPRQGSGKNQLVDSGFLICLLVTLVCFALFTNMLKITAVRSPMINYRYGG